MQRLRDEYAERLEAGDPDALESSRDGADGDGVPWRIEVALALGFVVLVGSVRSW